MKGLLYAQHRSIYIPNYHQTFHYSNTDKILPSLKEKNDFNSTPNNTSDSYPSTTMSPIEISSQILPSDFPSKMTTLNDPRMPIDFIPTSKETISSLHSTHTPNSMPLSSIDGKYNNYDYQELTSLYEKMNKSGHIVAPKSTTKPAILRKSTKLITNWSNQTQLVRKSLEDNHRFDIYNTTSEETIQQLNNRKLMQSLIHLLPPSLWSQIQRNQTIMEQDQPHYEKPSLPDPVLLAEAAAQAGLPSPGPYPIPEHLWPRIPPQTMTRLPKTGKFSEQKLYAIAKF